MRRLVALLALTCVSCAPPSYTVKLGVNRERWQPSQMLTSNPILSGLAKELQTTSMQCGNVRQQVDIELDSRTSALNKRRVFLAGSSGACGAAAGIYNAVATTPDKRVVSLLSACAAGTIVAAIPSLLVDDRIGVLNARLSAITAAETPVIKDWNDLEAAAANGQPIIPLAITFRADLVTLGSVCQ